MSPPTPRLNSNSSLPNDAVAYNTRAAALARPRPHSVQSNPPTPHPNHHDQQLQNLSTPLSPSLSGTGSQPFTSSQNQALQDYYDNEMTPVAGHNMDTSHQVSVLRPETMSNLVTNQQSVSSLATYEIPQRSPDEDVCSVSTNPPPEVVNTNPSFNTQAPYAVTAHQHLTDITRIDDRVTHLATSFDQRFNKMEHQFQNFGNTLNSIAAKLVPPSLSLHQSNNHGNHHHSHPTSINQPHQVTNSDPIVSTPSRNHQSPNARQTVRPSPPPTARSSFPNPDTIRSSVKPNNTNVRPFPPNTPSIPTSQIQNDHSPLNSKPHHQKVYTPAYIKASINNDTDKNLNETSLPVYEETTTKFNSNPFSLIISSSTFKLKYTNIYTQLDKCIL